MASAVSAAVELERVESVAWLTLQRPDVINAINDEIRQSVPRMLAELDADKSVRVVVIRGAGPRGFCVGADLKEQHPEEATSRSGKLAWIEAIADIVKPVIACIHGYCLGGGLEIALACDIRIASADATFGLPEPMIGLIPGGGGTQRLPRLIGLGRALDLLLSAERIDAAQAHHIGLISRLANTAAQLQEQTTSLAKRIAAMPPLGMQLVKEAARSGMDGPLSQGLHLESELFARLMSTNDRREAAAAFREKREPIFTGS
jgi:enoyl-CoA hydratase/carnithine racemase